MMRLRAAAAALLIALTAGADTAGAKSAQPPQGGGSVGTTPGVVLPSAAYPDLIVQTVSATAQCVGGKSVTATIKATVKNQSKTGTADLNNVPWQIILGATWWSITGNPRLTPKGHTVDPQAGGPKVLAPGQGWSTTLTILGIPTYQKTDNKPWQYGFAVRADPGKKVPETNEANNEVFAYAMDPCPK